MLSHTNNDSKQSIRAFGLVELLVSISIMVLVMSVIITRQSSFNGAVLLRNQAYELAFTIRQAQLLAVSGGDESLNARSYGVYISTAANMQTTYVLFQDKDYDGKYDMSPDEKIGLTGKLDSRFVVRGITDTAVPPHTPTSATITFVRPNFDAHFCGDAATCATVSDLTGPLEIDVARVGTLPANTDDGAVRRVEVTATGQITVVTYPQP
jgi:type II secretory pathway pseudopilin PulG